MTFFYWKGEGRAQRSARQLNQHAFIQEASFVVTVEPHEFKHQTGSGTRRFKNLSANIWKQLGFKATLNVINDLVCWRYRNDAASQFIPADAFSSKYKPEVILRDCDNLHYMIGVALWKFIQIYIRMVEINV